MKEVFLPPQGFNPDESIGLQFNKYFLPPQGSTAGGGIPPVGDDELIEETNGVFDHLLYDQDAGVSGFVLIEET